MFPLSVLFVDFGHFPFHFPYMKKVRRVGESQLPRAKDESKLDGSLANNFVQVEAKTSKW